MVRPSQSCCDGVNRTALLHGFRLQNQIQLLQQMLHVFQQQIMDEVAFQRQDMHATSVPLLTVAQKERKSLMAKKSVETVFPLS